MDLALWADGPVGPWASRTPGPQGPGAQEDLFFCIKNCFFYIRAPRVENKFINTSGLEIFLESFASNLTNLQEVIYSLLK